MRGQGAVVQSQCEDVGSVGTYGHVQGWPHGAAVLGGNYGFKTA